MASEAFEFNQPIRVDTGAKLHNLLALAIAALAPLAMFALFDHIGRDFGIVPQFFAPFGLPGWAAAFSHLALLPMVSMASWLALSAEDRDSLPWSVALITALIALPFVAPFLDALQSGLVAVFALLLAGAASWRLSRACREAGLLMIPVLVWLAIGATLGLTLAAAWSPPFALKQGGIAGPELGA